MSDTIYRGYDIRKGETGYWIYKGDACACDRAFPNEDAAMSEIDRWKREAMRAKAEG